MNKKYKILLIDDSPEWLKNHLNILGQLFEKDFFQTDTAFSGKNGVLKVLQEKNYDLIITDLEMEKVFDEPYAGVWLIKNLINKEECKNTKFLIISGAYNVWDMANKLKVDYIAKSSLIDNSMLLKYKIDELLKLNY